MAQQTIWNGTEAEAVDLLTAVEHNCACNKVLEGHIQATCAPHRMLAEDQRALNGLLFARRIVRRLSEEERLLDLAQERCSSSSGVGERPS
jgi:hypothetical protein